MTCPAGITRRITARRNVIFGAACRGCPLRERCTTSKTGRTLSLHEHDDLLRAARRDWAAGPGCAGTTCTHRPNVERTVAQVATCRGRRLKLRYRGTNQEQRLAQAPHRRAEPAQPARPGPDPPRRRLGTGHLKGQPRPGSASQHKGRRKAGQPSTARARDRPPPG